MELTIAIIAILAIVILPYWLLVKGYDENIKLTEDNTQLKTRLDALQSRAIPCGEESLTVESMMQVLQYYGFASERCEDGIRFKVNNLVYYLSTDRLPKFSVSLQFTINKSEFDPDRMRRAAYLMSDSLIMVKAEVDETTDENGKYDVVFYLVAMDSNVSSLRINFRDYIGIVEEGRRRMVDYYGRLEKEAQEASHPAIPAFLTTESKGTKVIS